MNTRNHTSDEWVLVRLDSGTTPQKVYNVLRMLYAKQDLLAIMTGSHELQIDEELVTLLKEMKPDSIEKIAALVEEETRLGFVKGLQVTPQAILVRLGRDLDADGSRRIREQLILKSAKFALGTRSVTTKRCTPTHDEEKYYASLWVRTIGMTGDRFAKHRSVLLGHLGGWGAFKSKEQAEGFAEQRKLRKHENTFGKDYEDWSELPNV